MNTTALTCVFRRIIILAVSAALCVCPLPWKSYADAAEQQGSVQTLECAGGWRLDYVNASDGVHICGVSSSGGATLSIPASVDATPVVAIDAGVFKGCSGLASAMLPDSIVELGEAAFFESGLTSIDLPSSLWTVRRQCFAYCRNLKTVNFGAETMGSLGSYAFQYCESLERLDIPQLVDRTGGAGEEAQSSIGDGCFAYCESLRELVFLSNRSTGATNYFGSNIYTTSNYISGCPNLESVVYCGNRGSLFVAGTKSTYYALEFFDSASGAAAGGGPVARVIYPSGASALELLQGTFDASKLHELSDAIPSAPQGRVWGIPGHVLYQDYNTLSNSYEVHAVSREDLDYAWLSSEEILRFCKSPTYTTSTAIIASEASFYMNRARTSVPGLEGISVFAADGSVLDSSSYELKFMRRLKDANGKDTADFEPVDSVDATGRYLVYAKGKGEFSGTETARVRFTVYQFKSEMHVLADASAGKDTAGIAASSAAAVTGESAYSVVVPQDSWEYALIASGLAGAGNGSVVPVSLNSVGSEANQAIVSVGADSVIGLGGTDKIGKSAESAIRSISVLKNGGTFTRVSASTVQDMAVQVCNSIVKYGADSFSVPVSWGDTALVVAPDDALAACSASQLAYGLSAPVLFTSEGGKLSEQALSALQSTDRKSGARLFSKVVLVGKACAAAGHLPARVEVEKLAENAVSAEDASYEISAYARKLHVGAEPAAVLASAGNPVNAALSGQLASLKGAALITVASTSGGKRAQEFFEETDAAECWLVGDFSAMDKQLRQRIESVWSSEALPRSLEAGDTFEHQGMQYKLLSSETCSLQAVLDIALTSATVPASASAHDGSAFKVASMAKKAFASCSAMKSLKVKAKGISAISASQFSGLKKLKSVSFATKVKKVGASAFKGCAKLSSVDLSGAQVIGASAFNGCASIGSVKLGAVKTIGSKAFYGCKALKSMTVTSSKLKKGSIGSAAFKGVASNAKVKVPAKKRALYKKLLLKAGLSAKAKVK